MTYTIVAPLPTRLDEETVHIVCCAIEINTTGPALCGEIVDAADWVPQHVPASCVVCADLADCNVCPVFGRCS